MHQDQGWQRFWDVPGPRGRDGSGFGMCHSRARWEGTKKKSEPEKQKGRSPTIPALLGELYLAIRASSITSVQRLSWGSAALGSAARSEQLSHLIVIPAAD